MAQQSKRYCAQRYSRRMKAFKKKYLPLTNQQKADYEQAWRSLLATEEWYKGEMV